MRTNAEEFRQLGAEFARRVNAARGPVRVLIPVEGFSEHTKRRARDLEGNDKGPWKIPGDYRIFVDSLKRDLTSTLIEELPLHINDNAFADACVDAFFVIANPLMQQRAGSRASQCGSTFQSNDTRPTS
jgi:uncharacterized protein (UPF0261 family)